jgi:hypothetical protein
MYVAPNANGVVHVSMSAVWWPLEYFPKNRKWKSFPENEPGWGYYLPRAEPRKIEDGALLHYSVVERLAAGYKPVNLPTSYETVGASPAPASVE